MQRLAEEPEEKGLDPDQRAATLSRLLLKLEEDGYVDGTGERILFLSFLLRDYWRRNHA